MKKNASIIFTILSVLLILDSLNVGHSLMMFYLAGIIPGTNIAIEGARMLELFALLAGFTLSRLSASLIAVIANYRTTERTTQARA